SRGKIPAPSAVRVSASPGPGSARRRFPVVAGPILQRPGPLRPTQAYSPPMRPFLASTAGAIRRPCRIRPFRTLPVLRLSAALILALVGSPAGIAQTAATGTVAGRVQNATNGLYVEHARIRVAGTARQTFTNAAGEYRLS